MLEHTDEDVDHGELFFSGVDLNRQQGQQTTILKRKSIKFTFRNNDDLENIWDNRSLNLKSKVQLFGHKFPNVFKCKLVGRRLSFSDKSG